MKYHALFVIFEKATKFLLQIIGGALRVNSTFTGKCVCTKVDLLHLSQFLTKIRYDITSNFGYF